MTQVYPGFPPQAPQYPPQPGYPPAPAQPAYPAAPAYPQPQQFAPGYPPMPAMPQPQPLAQGSLDDFYSQPSTGGGKSLSFQVGTRHIGVVARDLTSGDVQQQTAQGTNQPLFFKDGRPKFVLTVPLQMQPTAEYPDGRAVWWVKGAARDELSRAMSEAGVPAGPPQAGAIIDVSCVGERPVPNMNPQKQFRIIYTPPGGTPAAPAAAQPTVAPSPAPVAQQAPPAYGVPPQQPVPTAPAIPTTTGVPAAPQLPPQPVQQPQQAPAQPVAPQPPADLSPEQQQLLARLTGGQPQQG